jgi:hypothetical protein
MLSGKTRFLLFGDFLSPRNLFPFENHSRCGTDEGKEKEILPGF